MMSIFRTVFVLTVSDIRDLLKCDENINLVLADFSVSFRRGRGIFSVKKVGDLAALFWKRRWGLVLVWLRIRAIGFENVSIFVGRNSITFYFSVAQLQCRMISEMPFSSLVVNKTHTFSYQLTAGDQEKIGVSDFWFFIVLLFALRIPLVIRGLIWIGHWSWNNLI